MALHVLVIGISWPPSDTFIERRLRALVAAGVDVTVAVKLNQAYSRKKEISGVRVVNTHRTGWFQNLIAILKAFGVLLTLRPVELIRLVHAINAQTQNKKLRLVLLRNALTLIRLQVNLIHFEWNSSAINFEWVFDYFEFPSVISCRGRQVNIWPQIPGNEVFTAGLRRTLEKATAVHCVCQEICREAVNLGLDPNNSFIIYTAVDTNFFCPPIAKISTQSVHILMVGALIWRKGYEYALMAVKELIKRGANVRLTIVGEGLERSRLLFTIRDLRLDEYVTLTGEVNPESVRDLLHESHIFLHAGLSEGIANSVIEAIACGLPVVTTDCGGMGEAITDGVEGFVVPTRDPEAMAEAIIKLIDTPSLRVRMGQAGRARVLKQFTLERQSQEFIDMYRHVLSQPPRR